MGSKLNRFYEQLSKLKAHPDLGPVDPGVPEESVISAAVRVFIVQSSVPDYRRYLIPGELVPDVPCYIPGDIRRKAKTETAYIAPHLNEEFVNGQIDTATYDKIEPALAVTDVRVQPNRACYVELILQIPITAPAYEVECK